MRVIEFKFQDQEILRYRPHKRINLIGRASNCEIVLRRKDIQPVHFILEWIGEGEFEEGSGQWIIVDVTGREKDQRDSGMGVILKTNPLQLGEYSVRMIEDQLVETDLHRGILSRNINDISAQGVATGQQLPSKKEFTAEIITFSKSLEKIVNVEHFAQLRSAGRISPFKDLKNVQFVWNKRNKDVAFIENSGESIDFKLKHVRANSAIHLAQGNRFEMQRSDFVFLETAGYRYFIRIVPEIKATMESLSWLKDKTVLAILLLLVVLISLFVSLPRYQPRPMESQVPPRYARIEIQENPPAVEPPPEQKNEEKPPAVDIQPDPKLQEQALKVEQVQKAAEVQVTQTKQAPDKKNAPAARVVPMMNKNSQISKAGLNSPAPVKDVNHIGLLGKLKASKTATAKIDAKDITDTSVVDLAVTNRGVVIAQPKMGSLDGGAKSSKDLAGASTTLQHAQASAQSVAQNKMGIADSQAKDGLGLAAGGKGKGATLADRSSLGEDTGGDVDVSGGLDKESVRRAIRENIRAVRNCFETGLLKKKDLGGRLSLRWKIKPDGVIETIVVQSSNTGLISFDHCVMNVVKGIVFPKAPNKQPTLVNSYPFQFKERKL